MQARARVVATVCSIGGLQPNSARNINEGAACGMHEFGGDGGARDAFG